MEVSNPLVTIVIPVKNEAKRIRRLIEGIHKQKYRPLEVIFVDGGSTDGTVELIKEGIQKFSCKDFVVKLLREEDYGPLRSPGNARNIGALNASGDYVLFFDADFDLASDPYAINKIVESLKRSKHVVITYIPNEDTWIERQQAIETALLFGFDGKPLYLLAGFRKEVFNEVLFDTSLGLGEDLDFSFRVSPNKEYIIVDTNVRRCFPHTISELIRQQRWYGRTAIPYFKKYHRNIVMHLLRINAIPTITLLSTLLLILYLLGFLSSTIVLIVVIVGLVYSFGYRIIGWLIKDAKKLKLRDVKTVLERLMYILLREFIAKFFFNLGVMEYLIKRGKVTLGRE